jgi:cold shock CspA family protein
MDIDGQINVPTKESDDVNNDVHIVIEEEHPESKIGSYMGQCKWFNDLLGYGFVTICDGTEKGKDIFVHHSGIKPLNSNYRTLKKGEYLNFNVVNGLNGLQAIDITGINGGPLMCDFVSITRKGWEGTNTRYPMNTEVSPRMDTPKLNNSPTLSSYLDTPKAPRASTYPHLIQSQTPGQWLVVTKTGRKKNLAKYSKEGRAAMKLAKETKA